MRGTISQQLLDGIIDELKFLLKVRPTSSFYKTKSTKYKFQKKETAVVLTPDWLNKQHRCVALVWSGNHPSTPYICKIDVGAKFSKKLLGHELAQHQNQLEQCHKQLAHIIGFVERGVKEDVVLPLLPRGIKIE
jgi:hypothetical protein